jgi:pimeloyl-ACP methyl ester carboxylesterase
MPELRHAVPRTPGRWAAAALTAALLAACASPAERFDAEATALGLRAGEVAGAGFRHRVHRSPPRPGAVLHVYLDGDGTPYFAGLPAADPTARDPLILKLLVRDPAPAVLLGRPCYHGYEQDAGCDPGLWTSHRYAEAVVASLAAATAGLLADGGHGAAVLIGYSGGGALAMLLAERVPQTIAVVTIAANLDTDAWSTHQRHRPLTGSLNPATRPPLPPSIRQAHLAGSGDTVVPPSLTARGVRGGNATLTVIEGFDHRCCWADAWPEVLATALAGEAQLFPPPPAPR